MKNQWSANQNKYRSAIALFSKTMLTMVLCFYFAVGQSSNKHAVPDRKQVDIDREIAARFAPQFYQAVGVDPRGDYITNFDFDGDWIGDNNWKNIENEKFPLRGYVYYSVCETQTHYFIHYAVFHGRDYKGGDKKGIILSDLLRQGAEIAGKNDPTGLAADLALAHENDLEGALVVAVKSPAGLGSSKVEYVETLHHNKFSRYRINESSRSGIGKFMVDGQSPILYVEAKGHGIEAYSGDEKQLPAKDLLVYKYSGKAGDPGQRRSGSVDYDLVPIKSTFWARARAASKEKNATFGSFGDYGEISINILGAAGAVSQKKIKVGTLPQSFSGKVGGINMARPPWAWFDLDERKDPPGRWFFDPAQIVKRDFAEGESFSTAYVRLPFWAVK